MGKHIKYRGMAGKPADLPDMVANKPRRPDGGQEPLYDEQMTIQRSGNSLVVGVTSIAVDIQELQKGDKAQVYVFDGGVWVQTDDESRDIDQDKELFNSGIADAESVLESADSGSNAGGKDE